MSRVTPDEVKVIVTTTLTDDVIQIWIDAASAMVTKYSSCIGGDEDLLTQIELYLSAHFVKLQDPSTKGAITKEKLDVIEVSYAVNAMDSTAINSTTYGKTADMLAGGCLTDYNDDYACVGFF